MSEPHGRHRAEANQPHAWYPPGGAGYPPAGQPGQTDQPGYAVQLGQAGQPGQTDQPGYAVQPGPAVPPGYAAPPAYAATPGYAAAPPGHAGPPPGQPYGPPVPGHQPGHPGAQYQVPPYAGAPGGYPQRPRRRSGRLVIGLVIGLAVLLVGGVATAVVLVGRIGHANHPTAAGSRASGAISFTAPARIGSLTRASDQSEVDPMRQAMRSAGIADPFAVVYEDSAAPGHSAIAWGGTGSAFGTAGSVAQLDAFFGSSARQIGTGTVGSRTDADPGAVGGTAQCAPVDGTGLSMSICAWAGNRALLGFIFTGLSVAQSGTQMRAMLPAIVISR